LAQYLERLVKKKVAVAQLSFMLAALGVIASQ
jgi:hypothetical protein